jgi:uncharacterized protein (TIGR00730 family)
MFAFLFLACSRILSPTSSMAKLLCVYCSASTRLDPGYYRAAEEVGEAMVAQGWDLVYGGGNVGMMASVAQAVKRSGGRVVGVIPTFMEERELAYREADELVTVASMRDRKRIMEERASAFLALPGGIGTLEELAEVMTLRYISRISKPIVILNHGGYYDDLLRFFDRMTRERFKSDGLRSLYGVALGVDEVWPMLGSPQAFQADAIWRDRA